MTFALFLAMMLAQATPPPPSPEADPAPSIVVTGRTPHADRAFVGALTDDYRDWVQVPRWRDEICLTVEGVAPEQAVRLRERFVRIMAPTGLKLRRPGCPATMTIIVAENADAVVKQLAREFPLSWQDDGRERLNEFVTGTEPVRWISQTRDDVMFESRPSRLTRPTRAHFTAMIIVVDAGKIGAISLETLSDYVAMVGLTRPMLGRVPEGHSILRLFADKGDRPTALTEMDRDFIAALYDTSEDLAPSLQRNSIAAAMRSHLN